MLLPAELFDEVLGGISAGVGGALDGLPSGIPTGGGQRREPRVAVGCRFTVIPFAPGAEGLAGYDFPRSANGSPQLPLAGPLSVPVRDVSRGGLRFLMPRRLPLDTPFVLLLPRKNADQNATTPAVLAVECTVTYWQPVRRELFAIGAQFMRTHDGFVAPAAAPEVVLAGMPMEPSAAMHEAILPVRAAG